MHRAILYDQAQVRDYDVLHGYRETLYGLGQAVGDLLGSTGAVVAGLGATSNSNLTISLAAGDIYQLNQVDTTGYGSLSSDTTLTMQQGYAAAQSVVLSTTGISSGQSRYTLIYATFSQTDIIPGDDPNAGILNYLNATNPAGAPWSGPSNSGAAQNTRRQGVCVIQTVNGTPATTGSEVPPNVPGGGVPLYLIDLAFGQTVVTQPQILVAGPSAGTNVPSNYTLAPFLAGLQQKPTLGTFAGNPNTHVAGTAIGTAGSPAQPNFIWDTTNSAVWYCTTSGSAANAVWILVGPQRTLAGPVVRLAANLAAAGTSVTFTADSIGVATSLGGSGFTIASLNQALDVSSTGVNKMDTGLAPVSGFVSVYAIYNPLTGAVGVLGTTASQTTIYGGANMPAGYTMSALIAIWPTNASRQLVQGSQIDREFYLQFLTLPGQTVLSLGVATTATAVSLSAVVPAAARATYVNVAATDTGTIDGASAALVGSTSALNQLFMGISVTNNQLEQQAWIPMVTAQQLFYASGDNQVQTTIQVLGYRI